MMTTLTGLLFRTLGWLALTLAVAHGIARWRRRRPAPIWRPPLGRWRRAGRGLAGLAGVAILVVGALGTRVAHERLYAPDDEVTVRAATRPAPAPPALHGYETEPVASLRLIVHVVFAGATAGGLAPLRVVEHEVRWPADRGRAFEGVSDVGGWRVEHTVTLREARWYAAAQSSLGTRTPLDLTGGFDVRYQGRWGSGTSSASLFGAGDLALMRLGRVTEGPPPPLVALGPAPRVALVALATFTRVAEDDPLATAPATALLTGNEATVRQLLDRHGVGHDGVGRIEVPPGASPGVRLLAQIGPASAFLLLLATALIVQWFPGRRLAFPVVALLATLHVAGLEQLSQGIHLRRLQDQGAPLATRLRACDQLREAFLFRVSARRELDTVAGAPRTPDALRQLAREVSGTLR